MIEGKLLEYYRDGGRSYAKVINHGDGVVLWRSRRCYYRSVEYDEITFENMRKFIKFIDEIESSLKWSYINEQIF